MKTEQSYDIKNFNTLVDLNKDYTNFDLKFSVKSENGEPFKALVVNETTLSDESVPVLKEVEGGMISGNVSAQDDIYDKYYLILNSEEPCKVVVNVDINPLESKNKLINKQVLNNENYKPQKTSEKSNKNKKGRLFSMLNKKIFGLKIKNILGLVIVSGLGYFVYTKYFQKTKSIEDKSDNNSISTTDINEIINDKTVDSYIKIEEPEPLTQILSSEDKNSVASVISDTLSVSPSNNINVETSSSELLSKIENLPDL